MATMTIRLEIDPATNKKNIIVSLSSDADALPHEHEEQHRALVEKLIQGGVLKASELGKVIVEREEEEREPQAPQTSPGVTERKAQSAGES
jgi:FtsH ternary system-associated peptide